MSEQTDQQTAATRGPLRKLLAARGKLQGNFYFAGDTRGREAGLVVTLSARDPKGQKALSQGKALKKALPGAKFGRGLVRILGGKLVFELHAGTASPDHLKLGFKKKISTIDGLEFLKKAAVRRPDEGDDADADGEVIDADEQQLSVRERADVMDLIAMQGDLAQTNRELKQAFLSRRDAEDEADDDVSEQLSHLDALEKATPPDLDALAEARRALAASIYVGPAPFPEPGQPIPPEIQQTLKATADLIGNRLDDKLARIAAAVEAMYVAVEAGDPEWRSINSIRLLAELSSHQGAAQSYTDQLSRYLS